MTADYKKLFQSLLQKKYAPVYLIDGEEPYLLDQITAYMEEHILQPAERDFNLVVMYGREVSWADVVNACRRFPMFAERQVVILKEAAQLKDFGNLAGYLENPSPSTVFLIEHRSKKVDGRSKMIKLAKEKGFYFTAEKVREEQMPAWIRSYGDETGFRIGGKASELLATHLGNDLQKIVNEVEKVRINVPEEPELTPEMIQTYIGISRDYNIFEFPEVLAKGDKEKQFRMLSYFINHPKAAPMPLVIGTFYSYFSKLHQACFLRGRPDAEAARALATYPNRARDLVHAAGRIGTQRIEVCLLLLGQYSAYAVGVRHLAGETELLKELASKIDLALSEGGG